MVANILYLLFWLVNLSLLTIACLLCGTETKIPKLKEKTRDPKPEQNSKMSQGASKSKSKSGKSSKAKSNEKVTSSNAKLLSSGTICEPTQKSAEQTPNVPADGKKTASPKKAASAKKKKQNSKRGGKSLEENRTQEGSKENEQNAGVDNEYVRKAAAEGCILDPKFVKHMGNIDNMAKENQDNLLKDLENMKSQEASLKSKEGAAKPKKRVFINETKCKLYETNDVQTQEEPDENQEGEI